jgi:hypothetical protein
MTVDLAQIAYESSLRRLDKQEQSLTEIRSRTGLLLAVASLAASFVGRAALAGPLILAVPALTAFAVTIAASLYVLAPTPDLHFAVAGSQLYESAYELRDDIADVHKRLAYQLDGFWQANDRALERVRRSFRVAAWALGMETVLLLASVGGNLG